MKSPRIIPLALAFIVAGLASGSVAHAQTNPTSLANVFSDYWARSWVGVALSGNYLYAGNSDYYPGFGLHIIDVSEPSKPIDVGFHDKKTWCGPISVSGNNAYVYRGGGFTEIFDLSSKTNPVIVGSMSNGGGPGCHFGSLRFSSRSKHLRYF